MLKSNNNNTNFYFIKFTAKASTLALPNVSVQSYAAFTLNGFDDQKRNLTFVKTDFQVLKFKFYGCNFKQAFYPLHELNIT